MGKQVTIKGVVYLVRRHYADKPEYLFGHEGMDELFPEYSPIMPHELTVEFPAEFDPVQSQVAGLQKQKIEMQAEFAKKLMEIEDSISKLTCIGMDEVSE